MTLLAPQFDAASIFMFHHIANPPVRSRTQGLYVSPTAFSHFLIQLTRSGIAATSLTHAVSGRNSPSYAVTFDDAYQDVYLNALPELLAAKIPAILFVVSDRIGATNQWDEVEMGESPSRLMCKEQIGEWLKHGFEIGCHTRTHPYLTRLSTADLQNEVTGARKELEDTFGVPIRHFSYPYGDMNERVRGAVAEAGYQSGSTVNHGVLRPETDILMLPRIMIGHYRPKLAAALCAAKSVLGIKANRLPGLLKATVVAPRSCKTH